jgi:hypothetical protein
MDQLDGHRIQVMELLASHSTRYNEPRCFEDAQVFHHTEARHIRHFSLELAQRLACHVE